jgi:hypothetical protein
MSSCHETCLVATVMFDSVDEMYTSSCIQGQVDILSLVIEGLIFINLTEFFRCRVLPLGVLVVFIDTNSLFVVAGNWNPYMYTALVRNECSLVSTADKSFLGLGSFLESWKFPAGSVEYVLFSVDGNGNWSVLYTPVLSSCVKVPN